MAAFYKANVAEFLAVEPAKLLLALTSGTAGMGFGLKADQQASWVTQVEILATALGAVIAQEPHPRSAEYRRARKKEILISEATVAPIALGNHRDTN